MTMLTEIFDGRRLEAKRLTMKYRRLLKLNYLLDGDTVIRSGVSEGLNLSQQVAAGCGKTGDS